eukprot:GFKZ01006497.1.p1 GENE.GFKZ01006497.1~~GFKZ01006497.1.p1  ORF type:complete len:348 (+),score=48.22 GFKZ01006497.1:332-1375(+)
MDYVRYLRSKQTVDDRALNLRVLESLESFLVQHGSSSAPHTLRVVEVGGGVGAMFMRLLRRRKLFESHTHVEYTIADINHDVLLAAQDTILREAPEVMDREPVLPPGSPRYAAGLVNPDIASANGGHRAGRGGGEPIELCRIALTEGITITLVLGDALAYLGKRKACFDVVVAAAVLDLWELDSALKVLFAALDNAKGPGAFYFPINFDGTTDFFPASSEGMDFDQRIEAEFHRVMGKRKLMGSDTVAAHTGRRLIPCVKKLGASIKAVGGSSWIVSADKKHQYPADEAFFLDCIIEFIESSSPHFECPNSGKDPLALDRCLQSRRRQIADGSLVYVAHNVDVFGVL